MAEAPGEATARLVHALVRYPSRSTPIGPLDLTIAPGEIVAVVGVSGSGKSTLLRLLAGLETPAEGQVSAAPGRTSFVFQAPTLMPWSDAAANVALPLTLAGTGAPDARAKAAQALTNVGLGDRLDARPNQLSGGMAMRVSLARALVTAPDLLLLDEPFAALDSITRRGLIEDLHRLWSARPMAVVFVTHDVEEAVYLAQRIIVLDQATGAVCAELTTPGALPRPPRWRADPAYREAVEQVAGALAASMFSPFPLDGGRAVDGGDSGSEWPAAGQAARSQNTVSASSTFTPIPTLPPSRGKGS